MNKSSLHPVETEWKITATSFYAQEADQKKSPRRHALFAKAYNSISTQLNLRPNERVLDAGCGCGEFVSACKKQKAWYCGIDLSWESLRIAQSFHPGSNFVQADLQNLPFKVASFNAANAMTSLEFCSNRYKAISEIALCINAGGRLYLEVRNADFILFRAIKPLRVFLEQSGWLIPYPAVGFRDLSTQVWDDLVRSAGFILYSRNRSNWPWNFGNFREKFKNFLIALVAQTFSFRHHYLSASVWIRKAP
jgi:SAM-dependent methyltransferase